MSGIGGIAAVAPAGPHRQTVGLFEQPLHPGSGAVGRAQGFGDRRCIGGLPPAGGSRRDWCSGSRMESDDFERPRSAARAARESALLPTDRS